MRIHETIVADLGSTDGTLEMVREQYPATTLLAGLPNRGYGATANAGAKVATARWLLVTNSDVSFDDEDSVRRLIEAADGSLAPAIVGAHLIGSDGRSQLSGRALPRPWSLPAMFCAPLRYLPGLNARALGHLPIPASGPPVGVGWVTGAVLLLRRDVFEALDGFDERFFMNSEEVDLCARLHAAGGRVLLAPDVRVTHVGGGSSSPGSRRLAWLAAGKARYTRKHWGTNTLRVALALALLAYVASLPVWIARWLAGRYSLRDAAREAETYARALRSAWLA